MIYESGFKGEIKNQNQLDTDLSVSDLLPEADSKPAKDTQLSLLIQRSLTAECIRVADLKKRQSFEL